MNSMRQNLLGLIFPTDPEEPAEADVGPAAGQTAAPAAAAAAGGAGQQASASSCLC